MGPGVHIIAAMAFKDGFTDSPVASMYYLLEPAPPSFHKVFEATNIPLHGSTLLTFYLSNPNQKTQLTGVGFTETLPDGLVISTFDNPIGPCIGSAITSAKGSHSVTISNVKLLPGEECKFSVAVRGRIWEDTSPQAARLAPRTRAVEIRRPLY